MRLPQKSNQEGYMLQLDSLRGIAVFGVMCHHFLYTSSFFSYYGSAGVQLFFLLSGYLITGILLKCKDIVTSGKQNVHFIIQRFYIRRFLRLVPAYYLLLIITAIINIEPVRKSLIWHLTYTSNFYFSIINNWDGPVSHFWTLSVEEQFYLIWPFFILLVPNKMLLTSMLMVAALGPISRFFCIEMELSKFWLWTSIFTNLDSLAMGGVLAFCTYNKKQLKQFKIYLCNFGLRIGIPLYIFCLTNNYHHFLSDTWLEILNQTIQSFCFVWLVDRAAQGFRGITGTILELRLLTYLGKISYGIYLYHNFIPVLLAKFSAYILIYWGFNLSINFFHEVIITVIIAILSWHLIEKPINNFKQHFNYLKKEQ